MFLKRFCSYYSCSIPNYLACHLTTVLPSPICISWLPLHVRTLRTPLKLWMIPLWTYLWYAFICILVHYLIEIIIEKVYLIEQSVLFFAVTFLKNFVHKENPISRHFCSLYFSDLTYGKNVIQ